MASPSAPTAVPASPRPRPVVAAPQAAAASSPAGRPAPRPAPRPAARVETGRAPAAATRSPRAPMGEGTRLVLEVLGVIALILVLVAVTLDGFSVALGR